MWLSAILLFFFCVEGNAHPKKSKFCHYSAKICTVEALTNAFSLAATAAISDLNLGVNKVFSNQILEAWIMPDQLYGAVVVFFEYWEKVPKLCKRMLQRSYTVKLEEKTLTRPFVPCDSRWTWDSSDSSQPSGRRGRSRKRPRSATTFARTKWTWAPPERTGSLWRRAQSRRWRWVTVAVTTRSCLILTSIEGLWSIGTEVRLAESVFSHSSQFLQRDIGLQRTDRLILIDVVQVRSLC